MSLHLRGGRAAEIITLFEDSVLRVTHLAPGQRYTIGDAAGVDLPLAGFGERRELLRYDRRGGIEVVEADGLGVELIDGDPSARLSWVRELLSESRVAIISPGQRVRLSIGALTLLVIEETAPERHHLPPRFDLRAHASTAVVAIVFGLLLVALRAIPPIGASLVVDPFLLGQRTRRVQFVPAVLPTPPAGAADSSDEASGSHPLARPVTTRGSSARPRPTPIATRLDAASAKGLAAEAAMRAGALSVLGESQGSQVAAIFGAGSILGTQQEEVLGHLAVDTSCDGCSGAGLGTVPGRGGGEGGEDSVAAGRLATLGRGGPAGTPGGYGRSSGHLRGRGTTVPDVSPGLAETHGPQDKEMIRRAIRSHLNEIRFCYERELIGNEQLAGRVVPRFTIGTDGRVVAVVLQSSTMGNAKVDGCVLEAVRRIEFPRVASGSGLTVVSYPFGFQSAGH